MNPEFTTEVYGKWILSGEHAVLRGSQALVFPVIQKSFKLQYGLGSSDVEVEFLGSHGEEMRLLFHGVLERALQALKKSTSHIKGKFVLTNSIPVGAGMGASAALCVAVGRWLQWQGWVESEALYTFSRDLENMFHGESSGVDIAVALAGQGLIFSREKAPVPFSAKWQPYWYLSYCGQKGLTSVCIEKVKKLQQSNAELARSIDERMSSATQTAIEALQQKGASGFESLAQSIDSAGSCFKDWGLIQPDLQDHMEELKQLGAYAVKPTGSGIGGFVLSLWREEPPKTLCEKTLIPLPLSLS